MSELVSVVTVSYWLRSVGFGTGFDNRNNTSARATK